MVSQRLPRIRCEGNLSARLMTTGLLPPYPIYPPLAREASTPDAWLRPPHREGTRTVPLITMLGRWLTGRRQIPSADMRGRGGHGERVQRRSTNPCKDLAGHEPYANGAAWLKELPACTTRILDERHAGAQEAIAGEEKHIRARIESATTIAMPHVQTERKTAWFISPSTDPSQETVGLGIVSGSGC